MRVQRIQRERLPKRQEVHDIPDAFRQLAHVAAHELAQLGRELGSLGPLPDAGHLAEPTGSELAVHQVPQEEEVPLTQRPEPVGSRGVHGSLQCLLEQSGGLSGRQGLELEPGKVLVLPQRRNRVRRMLTGPQGDQDGGDSPHDKVVHHQRRELVKLVGIVDSNQRPWPGGRAQGIDGPAYDPGRIGAEVAEEALEGAKRRRPGGCCPVRPAGLHVLPCRALQRLPG